MNREEVEKIGMMPFELSIKKRAGDEKAIAVIDGNTMALVAALGALTDDLADKLGVAPMSLLMMLIQIGMKEKDEHGKQDH